MNARDLTGRDFGKLTVLSYAGRTARSHRQWRCLCVCGKDKVIREDRLLREETKSCGCGKLIQKRRSPQRDLLPLEFAFGHFAADPRSFQILQAARG